MGINNHFAKCIGGEQKDFVEFINRNFPDLEEFRIDEVDFLAQRVAQNLFYFEDNISTAKTDYIMLLAILIKKGVIFESILKSEK